MTIGMIVLLIVGLLVVFGVGQRALDRLRLTDKQAYVAIAAIIILGFIPEIRFGRVAVNLGGCVVPLILSAYLFVKAGSAWEKWRSVIAAVITGAVVWALMRFLPNEPQNMNFDPNWLYGVAAAVIAYLLGRSRRCAFIGGVVGVLLAQAVNGIEAWLAGADQTLALGGAGAFDTVVIAGFLGVMLAEIIGEIVERATRGKNKPTRVFRGGQFVKEEKK